MFPGTAYSYPLRSQSRRSRRSNFDIFESMRVIPETSILGPEISEGEAPLERTMPESSVLGREIPESDELPTESHLTTNLLAPSPVRPVGLGISFEHREDIATDRESLEESLDWEYRTTVTELPSSSGHYEQRPWLRPERGDLRQIRQERDIRRSESPSLGAILMNSPTPPTPEPPEPDVDFEIARHDAFLENIMGPAEADMPRTLAEAEDEDTVPLRRIPGRPRQRLASGSVAAAVPRPVDESIERPEGSPFSQQSSRTLIDEPVLVPGNAPIRRRNFFLQNIIDTWPLRLPPRRPSPPPPTVRAIHQGLQNPSNEPAESSESEISHSSTSSIIAAFLKDSMQWGVEKWNTLKGKTGGFFGGDGTQSAQRQPRKSMATASTWVQTKLGSLRDLRRSSTYERAMDEEDSGQPEASGQSETSGIRVTVDQTVDLTLSTSSETRRRSPDRVHSVGSTIQSLDPLRKRSEVSTVPTEVESVGPVTPHQEAWQEGSGVAIRRDSSGIGLFSGGTPVNENANNRKGKEKADQSANIASSAMSVPVARGLSHDDSNGSDASWQTVRSHQSRSSRQALSTSTPSTAPSRSSGNATAASNSKKKGDENSAG